jgi:hypothetical protein
MEPQPTSWMGRKLADFGRLWPAERKLVEEMSSGVTVVIGPDVPPEDAVEGLRLRASLLRYLAIGGCEDCRPPNKGLRVRGAYVEGDGPAGAESKGLDFEGCTLKVELGLIFCRIPDLVLLRGAYAQSLFFNSSHLVGGISCDGMEARRLKLSGARVMGVLQMLGAKLNGDLDCSHGTFEAGQNSLGIPRRSDYCGQAGGTRRRRAQRCHSVRRRPAASREDWRQPRLC